MGEIADDMIDGTCCSECGCYFIDAFNRKLMGSSHKSKAHLHTHGYPVLCWDCWEEGSELQKAEVETL